MSARVLYHVLSPRPRRPECDAVAQEIATLRSRFDGEVLHLHPTEYTRWPLPRLLFGLRQLPDLRRREAMIDVHHVYNPDPYPFPYLRFLKKPVVYTLAAGLRGARVPASFFSRVVARAVVADGADLQRLRERGVGNASLAPPGIDASRFQFRPIDLTDTLVMVCASAPWSVDQFESKGIDALLDAAAQVSLLKVIFLWRGHLLREMATRVRQRAAHAAVEVIDEVVDVNHVLARAHAAVVLAKDISVIKAYPHSLLEALAAGRPVLVSRGVPLADWVEREGCGVIVDRVEPGAIASAVAQMRADYPHYQANARRAGRDAFPIQATLDAYGQVYREVIPRDDRHG